MVCVPSWPWFAATFCEPHGAYGGYGVPGAPFFTLVDGPSGGVIGEGTATTWEQVRNLMSQSLTDAQPRGPGAGRSSGEQVDDELRDAGIEPGHPSLYPAGGAAPEKQ